MNAMEAQSHVWHEQKKVHILSAPLRLMWLTVWKSGISSEVWSFICDGAHGALCVMWLLPVGTLHWLDMHSQCPNGQVCLFSSAPAHWHVHASLLGGDKYLCGLFIPEIIKSLTCFCVWFSSMRRSSKIRTCNITNSSWWMNQRGGHVHVMMHRYYRSNQTNRWSRLKVTLISFWLSITGSTLLVVAGSAISIPVLLFGQHDRAALLWLTRWRITLSSSAAAFIVSHFYSLIFIPVYNSAKIFKCHSKKRCVHQLLHNEEIYLIESIFRVKKKWHGINSVSNFSNVFIGSWMDLLA